MCRVLSHCDFIDQYISCKLPPEDGKLKQLVLLLQQHKHSSYCKRNKSCRFNFPKPPSSKTLITKFDPENTDVEQSRTVLKKVQKLITEGNTDLSLTELLNKADETETEYVDALETSCTGNIVVLQCEPHECCINSYEQADLLGGYPSYEAHYRHVCDTVYTNESKYTKEDVDSIDVDENGPPEHL